MISIKQILTKSKMLISTLALMSMVIVPLIAKAEESPRFNFLDDPKMLRGLNDSAGDVTNWRDPVSGKPGDTFSGLIYYHNGVPGTIAKNTRIKLSLPTQSTDKKITVTSTVLADNAAPFSDSMTYTFSDDVRIVYHPERVTWFPNYHAGSSAEVLVGGQNGTELVGPNGLNIGDINGCWDFIGYVRYQFKIEKLTSPALSVEKLVRNFTIGESNFVDFNAADAGDVLEYRVNFSNKGNGNAENVVLVDVLPPNTKYIAGTTVLSYGAGEQVIADGITVSGITINNMLPETSGYVRFKVRIDSGVAKDSILVNTIHLVFDKEDLADDAKTKIVFHAQPTNPGGNLPVTGDETIYISILAGIAAIFVYVYVQKRKALATKSVK